jgi:hypothetical protein
VTPGQAGVTDTFGRSGGWAELALMSESRQRLWSASGYSCGL